MDGRKAVAAGFLVLASSTACAPWGPMIAIGAVGGAATAAMEVERSAPVARPSLREIFRDDGRFAFTPAPRALQARVEAEATRDPVADSAVKKIVTSDVTDREAPDLRLRTMAFVFDNPPGPADSFWEGFLRGFASESYAELSRERLRGADVAYGEVAWGNVLVVNVARDLFVTVIGAPGTPRENLDAVALHLLRNFRSR